MADITMCKGVFEVTDGEEITVCPQKDSCYRHTAPATPKWQSWFTTVPGKFINGVFSCDHFWKRKTD